MGKVLFTTPEIFRVLFSRELTLMVLYVFLLFHLIFNNASQFAFSAMLLFSFEKKEKIFKEKKFPFILTVKTKLICKLDQGCCDFAVQK